MIHFSYLPSSYIFCLQVIENQTLLGILHLLTAQQTNKFIVRGACWTISNITTGTKQQVQGACLRYSHFIYPGFDFETNIWKQPLMKQLVFSVS